MKSNFNIFILLFVCLLAGSIWHVVHVCMNVSSIPDHNPGNVTQLLGGETGGGAKSGSPFTNVTFSRGSSGDNAFSLNGLRRQNMSSTSRMKAKSAFSYARTSEYAAASPSSPTTSSPASPIGHMTSSADFHSFGGGGNVAVGSYVASSGSFVSSYSNSPVVYSQLPVSNGLLASTPSAAISSSSLGSGIEEAVVAAEQSFSMASSSYTSPFASSYAYNSYGVASYGATSNPNRLGGRQNAPSTGLGNSWLNWLDDHYGSTLGDDGTWNMDWQDAYSAWEALCASWNTTMGPAPTWEQFLAWLESNEGIHTKGEHTYNYVPVGNLLPLFLMALIYAIILFVKRNKTAQI